MTVTIEISNLSKFFGDKAAVDNVSLKIEKGQIVALLGPNGAGKSTLMNMICGYLAPSAGSIRVLGQDVSENSLKVRENIGFLLEGAPLYPDLSVRQFLNYMAELRGFYGEERDERVAAAEALAKVENVAQQKIETLSKGYSRRVGFAQSILSRPPVLLLDEPTDGLDPNQKRHIRSLISQMGKSRTIVISTHLLEEAESVCNRIVLVNKGRIMADGDLNEVLKQSRSRNLENAFRKLTTTEEEE